MIKMIDGSSFLNFRNLHLLKVQDLRKSLNVQRKELNDCRAEITALKMYIEGAQSNKQLFVENSDSLESYSIANSMEEARSLNNKDGDSKVSESITNKLASAVSQTEDTRKDHQVIRNNAEGPSVSEAPVSCTTDQNGGYGTSEEDKSLSNISSGNVTFNSNLHGASIIGKSQGSSDGISVYLSTEKLESSSKQKSSDKMVSVLVRFFWSMKHARLLLLLLIRMSLFIPVGYGDYKDSFGCTAKDCSLCAHKPP